jgi:hypothetical protein
VRPYASELDELVATSLGVLVEQEAIAGDRQLQSLQLVSPHHGLSGEETMDKEKKARRVFEGGVSVGSDIESFQSLAKANPNRCTFDTNRDLEKVAGVRGGAGSSRCSVLPRILPAFNPKQHLCALLLF